MMIDLRLLGQALRIDMSSREVENKIHILSKQIGLNPARQCIYVELILRRIEELVKEIEILKNKAKED